MVLVGWKVVGGGWWKRLFCLCFFFISLEHGLVWLLIEGGGDIVSCV